MPTEPCGTHVLATTGRLEVLTASQLDGLPLVFHDGTPGGLVAFPAMADAAAERGLRTVMYARPGYGDRPAAGPPHRGRSGRCHGGLDRLGARQFVTTRWSGGGPHTLACAALLPAGASPRLAGRGRHRPRPRAWTRRPG